jgi:hypothetical protein
MHPKQRPKVNWIASSSSAEARAPAALKKGTRSPWLVDEFVDSYVCWREECDGVRAAYEDWERSEPQDRALAFVVYRAALDREECAARTHREWTERLATAGR